jgi:phosphoglycolate phosphatase-like HAD superfamily hydrolase
MKLILFDIDGTLVNSGGAGYRAFSKALETTLGLEGGLNGVRLDGKTDLQIVREVFDRRGLEFKISEDLAEGLFDQYIEFLRNELSAEGVDYRVLPGVSELLSRLREDSSFLLGIASGNIEQGAWLKLEKGGLNEFFDLGGYGSDSESRTELIKVAIERARRKAGNSVLSSVVVIGDTPRDIRHGQEAGAQVVAVATGRYPRSLLEEHRPDLCLESLVPIDPILRFLSSDLR